MDDVKEICMDLEIFAKLIGDKYFFEMTEDGERKMEDAIRKSYQLQKELTGE
jgi:hypothetical protein